MVYLFLNNSPTTRNLLPPSQTTTKQSNLHQPTLLSLNTKNNKKSNKNTNIFFQIKPKLHTIPTKISHNSITKNTQSKPIIFQLPSYTLSHTTYSPTPISHFSHSKFHPNTAHPKPYSTQKITPKTTQSPTHLNPQKHLKYP